MTANLRREWVIELLARVKQIVYLGGLALFFFSLVSWGGSEKLHPSLRMILNGAEMAIKAASDARVFDEGTAIERMISPVAGEVLLGVLVKTTCPLKAAQLGGVVIRVSTDTVHGLWVTTADLASLAENECVAYIEPSRRLELRLDTSLPEIAADTAHSLVPPIRGAGVVVGAVDTGIDYSHLDFRYDSDSDGFEEASRILGIWDQTQATPGGLKYSQEEIESDIAGGYGASEGIVLQRDDAGHGTHVLGIAVGDGTGSAYGMVGIAPDSWIVAVKTTFYESDILAGVEYIFDVAEERGVPAVVNLSIGGHDGPHDGTSLLEQGLDELASQAGRVIVVSAGNEGNGDIHWGMDLRDESGEFDVVLDGSGAELSIWYPGDASIDFSVMPPDADPVLVSTGNVSGVLRFGSGILYVDHASGGANVLNGDSEIYVRISDSAPGARWRMHVSNGRGDGRCDAWVYSGDARLAMGDASMTIAEPGTARNVITVGGYVSRVEWVSLVGLEDYSPTYSVGTVASYSSQGPTRDGRLKPDLIAPGTWIAAAKSDQLSICAEFVHEDGVHVFDSGTSMSAAHVAGAAALLLSVDDSLRADDVRDLLTSTARTDAFTGVCPNMLSGWGKMNVFAALESLGYPGSESHFPDPVTPVEVSVRSSLVSETASFTFSYPTGDVRSSELRIYDVAGRRVFEANVTARASYVWNLRASSGQPLSSGLYFYVLVTSSGISEVGRLVIQR